MSVEERAREHDRGVSEFGKLYAASKLPAEKNSGSFGGADALRWKKQGWPDVDFDVETWLPIFVGGARETAEPQRMIAIQGSKQMMRQPTERILPMIPVLVPALGVAVSQHLQPAGGGGGAGIWCGSSSRTTRGGGHPHRVRRIPPAVAGAQCAGELQDEGADGI